MAKQYYWIVAKLEGQPYLTYGGENVDEARKRAFELLSTVDFSIQAFPTRNQQTASAMLRGKRLEHSKDLKTATKRIRHTITKRKRR